MSENADENSNSKSSELITNEPLEDSPLRLVGKDGQYGLTMNKYRVSPWYQTKEDALNASKNKSWELIMNIVGVMLILHDEHKLHQR